MSRLPHSRLAARIPGLVGIASGLLMSLVAWAHTGTGAARLSLLSGALVVFSLIAAMTWRIRVVRYSLLAVAVGTGALCLLPAREYDVSRLRSRYVESLLSYEEAPYRWGGENGLGIDCSGLVRRAFVDALLREGAHAANGGLIRDGLQLWWHDRTANALAGGYRGETESIAAFPGINGIDPRVARPGDLAVTQDGVHVLAFVGGAEWIEADPVLKKVICVDVPSENPWFQVPVYLVRWSWLGSRVAKGDVDGPSDLPVE